MTLPGSCGGGGLVWASGPPGHGAPLGSSLFNFSSSSRSDPGTPPPGMPTVHITRGVRLWQQGAFLQHFLPLRDPPPHRLFCGEEILSVVDGGGGGVSASYLFPSPQPFLLPEAGPPPTPPTPTQELVKKRPSKAPLARGMPADPWLIQLAPLG